MDGRDQGEGRPASGVALAHVVGVAERGMPGLAQWLALGGLAVSGSAGAPGPTVERLRRLGVRVHAGHAPGACPAGASLLVHAPRIGREHPERLAAARRGIAQHPATGWLDRLAAGAFGLAVAGRADAGVVAAMIGWVLTRSGYDPSVVLGSPAPQLGGWARLGGGPHLVAEAMVEQGAVSPSAPRVAVIVDPADAAGPGGPERAAALRRFAASVPEEGVVLAQGPGEHAATLLGGLAAAVEWISLEERGGWWGADLREDRGRYQFRAFHRGRFVLEARLRVPGRRRVLSALASVAACGRLGVPAAEIGRGLEEFEGVARDFEPRGSYRGVTLVDDEARDPATLAEVPALCRRIFGSRRLWMVYHPPAWGGDLGELGRLVGALAAADRVLLLEPSPGGPAPGGPCEAGAVERRLVSLGVEARRVAGLDEAIRELDRGLEPGDVLVTLGAGDVGTIADAFIRRLPRDRQGR